MAEPPCIFCRIAAREARAEVLRETGDLLAFRDINPQAPLHALVIPKAHIATLNDLTGAQADLAGRMLVLGREVAGEQGLAERGYRLVMNCGREAGQTVYHVHLHVLGGRYLSWPPG